MTKKIILFLVAFFTANAFAECPEGTWPRNLYGGPGGGLYKGPGGGMYKGPGGGMYKGPGGGLYKGPGEYCSNTPPWPVFIQYLEENGYEDEAKLIKEELYQ